MDLIVKNRNHGKLSERQRNHIEEKLGKLERYLDALSSGTVEVSTETRRNAGEVYRVQVTLVGDHGIILRAEDYGEDLYTAVDEVRDNLQRQVKRYKEKHWRRGKMRRQGGKFVESEPTLADEVVASTANGKVEPIDIYEIPQIVRTKEFALRPMYSDEAVEQMELIGHNFFIFRDADTSHISVVYRRRDGNYGLIVPEEGS